MSDYKNIVIFTKTLWKESPRIRHQLTRLLLSNEHKITFFERCNNLKFKTIQFTQENINFVRHFEFLHHQLRPLKILTWINNTIVKFFIRKNVRIKEIDLVINFNYDYNFLKEIFKKTKVITIINDDFVAQAKPWMKKSISYQLENTCRKSDLVFTMHYSLYSQLKSFNKNTYIFLPWAGNKYIAPTNTGQIRNTVLFWGFIDQRVDWELIKILLQYNIKIRFIGHILTRVKHKLKECEQYNNFELVNATPIEKINFSDVCCGIIPYNINKNGVKSISISNRTFQLLSYGIPILHTELPYLIEAPQDVIRKCKNSEDFIIGIDFYKNNFYLSQKNIERFLSSNYSENRYNELFKRIKAVNNNEL